VWWAWVYETLVETNQPSTFRFLNAAFYQKNRRVFRQGMFIATPEQRLFNFDLKFPRGLPVEQGERETYQVSLLMAGNFTASGGANIDSVRMMGWGKVQYPSG